MSLRGGFDCSTWTRSPKFAWPDLDSVNETLIDNAGLALDGDFPLSLTSNVIVGGVARCSSTPCGVAGVLVRANSKPVDIAGNRIFAGEVAGGPGSKGIFIGVHLNGVQAPSLVNNTVHSGNRNRIPVEDHGYGVIVNGAGAAIVQHNTFFTSQSAFGLAIGGAKGAVV